MQKNLDLIRCEPAAETEGVKQQAAAADPSFIRVISKNHNAFSFQFIRPTICGKIFDIYFLSLGQVI